MTKRKVGCHFRRSATTESSDAWQRNRRGDFFEMWSDSILNAIPESSPMGVTLGGPAGSIPRAIVGPDRFCGTTCRYIREAGNRKAGLESIAEACLETGCCRKDSKPRGEPSEAAP